MKTCISLLVIALFTSLAFGQKVSIKDNVGNILMEVFDEGTTGSIYLPASSAPSITTNKLYSIGSDLYWFGSKLGTEFDAAGWHRTGSVLHPSNLDHRVAIGSNSSTYPLEVHWTTGTNNIGPAAVFRTKGAGNSVGAIRLQNTADHYYSIGITQGPDHDFAIAYDNNISLASDLVRLTSTGALGIGTIDPLDPLHVVGDMILEETGNPLLKFYLGSTYAGYVGLINTDYHISNLQNGNLFLKTQNLKRVTVDGIGRVGIGTENPAFQLHVFDNTFGDVALNIQNANDAGTERLYFGYGTTDAGILVYGPANGVNPGKYRVLNNYDGANFDWVASGQIRMALTNDGYLGVGTSSPSARHHIVNVTSTDAFRVDDNATDTTPFVINSGGDVGIGDTSPDEKLDVNGNIRAQGMVYAQEGDQKIILMANPTQNYVQLDVDGVGHTHDDIIIGDASSDDNRVGIGTDDPESLVHVQSDFADVEMSQTGSTISYALRARHNLLTTGGLGRRQIDFEPPSTFYSTYVGVYGWAQDTSAANNYGVVGVASGASNSNYAGLFSGDVQILGDLSVSGDLSKGSGSFKIDHPLDPENKYLYHSFVESPDMMNVYNGNVMLNADGSAIVTLPDWFEALNKDFRYQLTAIGAPGPNLYIAQEISANQFVIAGGTPSTKVSWQVTGIRKDPYAEQNRIEVEVEKALQDRGTYLHPKAYTKANELQED